MGQKEIRMTRRSFVKGIAGAGAVMAVNGINTETAMALSADKDASDHRLTDADRNEKCRIKDDMGRIVELPSAINKIVPSGKYAEAVLMTLCPDKMASITEQIEDEEEKQFVDAGLSEISDLAETGEMYPAETREESHNFDIRKVDSVKPDMILDIGTKKDDLNSTLEYTQVKSDTPVIFLDGTFGRLPDVYRKLGDITGCHERAEELAAFIEHVQETVNSKRDGVKEKAKIYYAGNNNRDSSAYSFQNEAIKAVGAEPVILYTDNKTADIDFIIFNDGVCLNEFLEENVLDQGKCVVSPAVFHNWLGFPMFAQVTGMIWIGYICHPEIYSSVFVEAIQQFYELFYSYKLSNNELAHIIFGDNDK